ncbi:LGFP repeat-containing protein [Streptomyces flaveolus]|uniref:LGFP repeat-containing protein n=1 Tax=Streptomyces flaveolus TaxID=67297 RepID=UPI0036F63541
MVRRKGQPSSTPTSGPTLQGAIQQKWFELGSVGGQVRYPKSDEQAAPHNGRIREFAGGTIAWHPETGAFSTFGLIRDRWKAVGGRDRGYPAWLHGPSPSCVAA